MGNANAAFTNAAPVNIEKKSSAVNATSSRAARDYFSKHELLKNIPSSTIRKSWFAMAHLLLPPDAKILDMACMDGQSTYVMALLNPQYNFTGIDKDESKIRIAQENFQLPNLTYQVGDITTGTSVKTGSVDAVIDSFVLHWIHSEADQNHRSIVETLKNQFKLLKEGGMLFIRDYAMLSEDEYVLLEVYDRRSRGPTIKEMSEAELLIWFSNNARTKDDQGLKGFYLEELASKSKNTRLFRLPFKWANEFIMRKDNYTDWEKSPPKEFTFFTQQEYKDNLKQLGGRVLYTAPYWNETKIKERYDGRFVLYDDNGIQKTIPPSSFTAVTQKMADQESLRLTEHRPSQSGSQNLKVKSMVNNLSGRISDLVCREERKTDIIPYRVSKDGQLYVYMLSGVPRGIVNSIPRSGQNIDQKSWSGHFLESIKVDNWIVDDLELKGASNISKFFKSKYKFKVSDNASFEKGQSYFPMPEMIDDYIHTYYIMADNNKTSLLNEYGCKSNTKHKANSLIKELNAQTILNAIAVGLIPNARLEMQIQELYKKLGLGFECWFDTPLAIEEYEPEDELDRVELMNKIALEKPCFKETNESAGHLRCIQSQFIDEGLEEGDVKNIGAIDLEFMVPKEGTSNLAVILPLCRKSSTGEICVGIQVDELPVPQRYNQKTTTLKAPSFYLPRDIENVERAKQYIAQKFDVPDEYVSKLGESYFCHIEMTPLRVFPFAVSAPGKVQEIEGGPYSFIPISYMRHLDSLFGYHGDFNADELFLSALKKIALRSGQYSEQQIEFVMGKDKIELTELRRVYGANDLTGVCLSDRLKSFNDGDPDDTESGLFMDFVL